jgi:hypothetical protein
MNPRVGLDSMEKKNLFLARNRTPTVKPVAIATMTDKAKLVPTLADRGCYMVSVTNPYGRILGFLDRSRYFFFQVAPQLYSRG